MSNLIARARAQVLAHDVSLDNGIPRGRRAPQGGPDPRLQQEDLQRRPRQVEAQIHRFLSVRNLRRRPGIPCGARDSQHDRRGYVQRRSRGKQINKPLSQSLLVPLSCHWRPRKCPDTSPVTVGRTSMEWTCLVPVGQRGVAWGPYPTTGDGNGQWMDGRGFIDGRQQDIRTNASETNKASMYSSYPPTICCLSLYISAFPVHFPQPRRGRLCLVDGKKFIWRCPLLLLLFRALREKIY